MDTVHNLLFESDQAILAQITFETKKEDSQT